MLLLIDENVPLSVANVFVERGHDVRFVRDILAAGSPDAVVSLVGDRLSAIVVTWDQDFDNLVRRIPAGSRTRFRHLGRISFRCNPVRGREMLEKWIEMIELQHHLASRRGDFRMICTIQTSGVKFS